MPQSISLFQKGGNMEQMFGFIANMGFPIVVSVYLLVRVENRLETLTLAINKLSQAVTELKM